MQPCLNKLVKQPNGWQIISCIYTLSTTLHFYIDRKFKIMIDTPIRVQIIKNVAILNYMHELCYGTIIEYGSNCMSSPNPIIRFQLIQKDVGPILMAAYVFFNCSRFYRFFSHILLHFPTALDQAIVDNFEDRLVFLLRRLILPISLLIETFKGNAKSQKGFPLNTSSTWFVL